MGEPVPTEALPPPLQINPVGSSVPRPSVRLSLAATALAYGLVGGTGYLAYRAGTERRPMNLAPGPGVGILLTMPDDPGSGGPRQAVPQRPATKDPVPPPAPPPTAPPPPDTAQLLPLPTEPIPVPPALPSDTPFVAGAGGHGGGSGAGTGTGQGSGTGEGGAAPPPPPREEPVHVPYSQIGLLRKVDPAYPERARRSGSEGIVVVRVTIDEEGTPVRLKPLGGDPLFLEETLRVLPLWRFTPVTQKGRKVRATFDAMIRFSLA